MTQKLTYAFGIGMALLMGITLILPAITPNTTTIQPADQIEPTDPPPPPTLPPPVTDFSGITFDQDYLHPSGLFSIGIPTGWFTGSPTTSVSNATATLNNPTISSVIEVSVQQPEPPIASADELSALFTTTTLQASWRNFATWDELSRRVENNRVLIDYTVQDRNQARYIAQDSIWFDKDWVYRTRVIVPANMSALLNFMIDAVTTHIKPNTQFEGTALNWQAFFDTINHHILRYPPTWRLTDTLPGQPTSFEGNDGTVVRVEATDGTVADADAASDTVQSFRSGIEITSVDETSRNGGDGFSVAYSYTDPDGESYSGLAILLNGEDGKLHIADALVPVGGLDLNNPEENVAYSDLMESFNAFSLITNLNLLSADDTASDEG
jgi:hypothetical protein